MSAVVVATADLFRGINMLINGYEPYRTRASADIVRNHGLRDPKDGEYVLDTYLLRGPRPPRRADAVSETARAVAAFAPDRAEEIAAGIADEPSRANALAGIALVVAATGLDRALEIIAVIGDRPWGRRRWRTSLRRWPRMTSSGPCSSPRPSPARCGRSSH
ncbi:hypothetical protein ACFWBI_19420 [Streptomyces sp. NPDC059982]|uniref:hypothetical protein n=1 Tax=unclassified Streptomyces TaxID=2593676 RepID=UPI0036C388DA